MASSRAQSTKGVEKRKRDRIDQEDPAQKKKRRPGKTAADKNERASTPSRNGDATESLEGGADTHHETLGASVNGIARETKSLQQWRISEPMGGRMSDVDPIFSDDEK